MPGVGVQSEVLRHTKGLFIVLALEVGERGATREEVLVGGIQILQGLLERLRVDFPQPFGFRLLLQRHQGVGGIGVVQALLLLALMRGVVVHPLAQEVIVDKPRTPELSRQPDALLDVRVEAELEGLMPEHGANRPRSGLLSGGPPGDEMEDSPRPERMFGTCG